MKLPIIVNEAGKLYIEAVPQLGWGKGKECTFLGALEAALSVTTAPPTYENLMGWSALAFRTRWYQGESGRRWCPSCPIGETSEEIALLRQATGWELRLECSIDDSRHAPPEFTGAITEEIRAGRPILAYEPQLNVSVVYGFEDAGRTLLLRDYVCDEPAARLPIEKIGSFLCFLGQRHEPLDPAEAMFAGIRRGMRNWHRSPLTTPSGRFWYGRAAFLKWREDLQHAEDLPADQRRLLFFVNWWNFDALADARAAAVRFLRRNAEFLLGRQHQHQLQAADLFAEEIRLLRRTMSERLAFLGPWTGKGIEQWTTAVRQREIAVLGEVLARETEAFGELENLLTASSVPQGALEAAPV